MLSFFLMEMLVRLFLNNHPLLILLTLTCAMVGGIVGLLYFRGEHLKGADGYVWYWEEQNGGVYLERVEVVPPGVGPGGHESVRMKVFECGSGGRVVGWLERYSPAGKAKLEQLQAGKGRMSGFNLMDTSGAIEIRELTGHWVYGDSAEGEAIMRRVRRRCAGLKMARPRHRDDLDVGLE